ncbi:MAG: putative dsRNA-binding protein, partial [bacterium]
FVEDHQAILADAYEALIGAIYLDGGIESVIRFLERFHFVEEINLLESRDFVNFKGKLLEFLQSQGFSPPKYKLERVLGPDHRKYYLISAWSEGKFLGLGGGFSRKEAEQQAAERALKILLKEEK